MKKLFLVDDDPIIVFLIQNQIKDHADFEILHEFSSADTALAELKRVVRSKTELPDIILLDLNMPLYDGWSLLDNIAKLDFASEVSIVLITSKVYESDIERSKLYPMVKYILEKPIMYEDLKRLDLQ